MTIWAFLRGRVGAATQTETASPDPADTEEYRQAMERARAMKAQADRIIASHGEPKRTSTRPA